jgi:hypothetical protein
VFGESHLGHLKFSEVDGGVVVDELLVFGELVVFVIVVVVEEGDSKIVPLMEIFFLSPPLIKLPPPKSS